MARLFEENGYYNTKGLVLPFNEFKLFSYLENTNTITYSYRDEIISYADEIMHYTYPTPLATQFMRYKRDGNRTEYQRAQGQRVRSLIILTNAEYATKTGKYIDSIIDLIWCILEQTTWVLPAHFWRTPEVITPEYDGNFHILDIVAPVVGTALAFTYHFLYDELNAVSYVFTERIKNALYDRIIKPFMADDIKIYNNWCKSIADGYHTNNWNPWICANVLTIMSLIEEDTEKREEVLKKALEFIDNFIECYQEDGGCDEGPAYWNVAGGALLEALTIITDITGNKVNIYNEPLVKNIAEYIANVHIVDNNFTSFSDGPAQCNTYDFEKILTFAKAINSSKLLEFAHSRNHYKIRTTRENDRLMFIEIENLLYSLERCLFCKFDELNPSIKKEDGVKLYKDLQIALTRKNNFFLAVKGGHNGESHNHLDLGSFLLFSNDQPLLLDVGCGTYTRKTFTEDRYKIWSMQTEYHNTMTFDGLHQEYGRDYHTDIMDYDEKTGKITLSLNKAYPKNDILKIYNRSAYVEGNKVIIEDCFELNKQSIATINLITPYMPKEISTDSFAINKNTIHFDKSLNFSYEIIDCNDEETRNIPVNWKTDYIYRICLKNNGQLSGKYKLVIE